LRYFFKRAYGGFLPDETLRKSKHGFGLPFGEWAVSHAQLGAFVRENLDNLKARHLIRADFIDRLMDTYLPKHPQYYGTIVWLLLMLEQWHQQHRSV
jgi:asparagine synthase (glutamine-hydrolysing)